MREIEVRPGYYEWNIYVDSDLFYAIDADSLSDYVVDNSNYARNGDSETSEVTFEGVEYTASQCIEEIQEERENGLNDLTWAEQCRLHDALTEAWAEHFGV